MWTSIQSAGFAAAGRVRALIAGVAVMLAAATAPAHAAVEYMKVCDLYGAGFYYIPGTDTCTDARQIVEDQFAIARAITRASTATAMASALVTPFLPSGANFAISTHWATFNGQHAVGFAGMMRLWGNLALTTGIALGLDNGSLTSLSNRTQTAYGTAVPEQSWSEIRVLGRFGLTYSW